MEGILTKWTNIISRWKKRYVVIEKDKFTYYKKKGGAIQGTYTLKDAKIEIDSKKPKRFYIRFLGGETLHFKAPDVKENEKWVKALKDAKGQIEKVVKTDHEELAGVPSDKMQVLKSQLISILRNRMLNESSKLNKNMLGIFTLQEQLEGFVSELKEELSGCKGIPPSALEKAEKIQNNTKELKAKIQAAALEIEDAKADVTNTVKDIISKTKEGSKISDKPKKVSNPEEKKGGEKPRKESKSQEPEEDSSEENSSFYDEVFYDAVSEGTFIPPSAPGEHLAIKEGKSAGKELDIRTTLPVKRNARQKVSFWTMLKDMIGKDLTRVSLPVYFNEPLGLLQKAAECFENDYLLDKAGTESNPYLRLAYIAAFNASQYNACFGDKLKPFNPILGETYEYVTDRYRFFCEQVTHHPPVSACHCESKNYVIYFNTQVTNRFWGNSIEFRPLGKTFLHLKKFNEDYTFNRPVNCAQNIIFGKLYLDLSGETVVENIKTGDKCVVKFRTKGWSSSSLGNLDGFVFNKAGEKIYEIKGKWCDSIWATEIKTGDSTLLWKKFPLPDDWVNLYCFTMHSLQLNYLPESLKKILPPTDTRLRPDQRAYENGDIKLASSEKNRLEEKQREARKIMEKNKVAYKPAYFIYTLDPVTKEQTYLFTGKYWSDREKQNWKHLPDLY